MLRSHISNSTIQSVMNNKALISDQLARVERFRFRLHENLK